MLRTCKWCGKQFDPSRPNGSRSTAYCSGRCYSAANREEQKERQRRDKEIEEFHRRIGGGNAGCGELIMIAIVGIVVLFVLLYRSCNSESDKTIKQQNVVAPQSSSKEESKERKKVIIEDGISGNKEELLEEIAMQAPLDESLYEQIVENNEDVVNEDVVENDVEEIQDDLITELSIKEELNEQIMELNDNEEGRSNFDLIQFVVINATDLRIRMQPSISSETLKWKDGSNRHPRKGEKFKYLGETDDFYNIDFNGKSVWVSKQFSYIESDDIQE